MSWLERTTCVSEDAAFDEWTNVTARAISRNNSL